MNPDDRLREALKQAEIALEDTEGYTKLTTKVKRGTGTRDQDSTKVVTKHPDPEVAASRHHQAVTGLQATADAARSIQPDHEPDQED